MVEHADLATSVLLLVGVFVVFGFGLSAYYHKKQKDSNDASLMLEISNEISTREKRSKDVKTEIECAVWTKDYANYLDLVTNMLNTNKLDKSYGEFFKIHLMDGYESLLFVHKTFEDVSTEHYQDLKKWYETTNEKLGRKGSAEIIMDDIQANFI